MLTGTDPAEAKVTIAAAPRPVSRSTLSSTPALVAWAVGRGQPGLSLSAHVIEPEWRRPFLGERGVAHFGEAHEGQQGG